MISDNKKNGKQLFDKVAVNRVNSNKYTENIISKA